jgi:hypothetical protein
MMVAGAMRTMRLRRARRHADRMWGPLASHTRARRPEGKVAGSPRLRVISVAGMHSLTSRKQTGRIQHRTIARAACMCTRMSGLHAARRGWSCRAPTRLFLTWGGAESDGARMGLMAGAEGVSQSACML